MKFISGAASGVIVELDATDCLVLADCLVAANRIDIHHNHFNHIAALSAAFTASAIVAALDTLEDGQVPGEAALADTRRVWGPPSRD